MEILDWAIAHLYKDGKLVSIYGTAEEVQELLENQPENVKIQFFNKEYSGEDFNNFAEEVERSHLDADVFAAYIKGSGWDISNAVSSCEEAYSGEFSSDEEFAEDMADQLGLIDSATSWPQNCIDWEMAAKELMHDYFEQDGYYFRYM